MGERHQRIQCIEIALTGAVIGLQRPKRGDHRTRYAELLFSTIEDVGIFFQIHGTLLQPVVGNHP